MGPSTRPVVGPVPPVTVVDAEPDLGRVTVGPDTTTAGGGRVPRRVGPGVRPRQEVREER